MIRLCICRHKVTVLKTLLCVTTLAGATMVVQPTFLFSKSNTNTTNITSSISEEEEEHINSSRSTYLIGVIVAFVCAISAALSNVLSAKAKKCPLPLFMVATGIGTLILALICPLINLPNRFIQFAIVPGGTLTDQIPLIIGVSAGSVVGGLFILLGCQYSSPTLVAVVRSSEILLAMIADYVIFKVMDTPSPVHIAGSVLVLLSVTLMAASDWIQDKFLKDCCSPTKPLAFEEEEDIVDEKEQPLMP